MRQIIIHIQLFLIECLFSTVHILQSKNWPEKNVFFLFFFFGGASFDLLIKNT